MSTETVKVCTKCKETKPLADFYLRNKEKGWRFSACIKCSINKTKIWQKTNPEKARGIVYKWRENNEEWKEKQRIASLKRWHSSPDYRERHNLLRRKRRWAKKKCFDVQLTYWSGEQRILRKITDIDYASFRDIEGLVRARIEFSSSIERSSDDIPAQFIKEFKIITPYATTH